jgi:hypothetical protein
LRISARYGIINDNGSRRYTVVIAVKIEVAFFAANDEKTVFSYCPDTSPPFRVSRGKKFNAYFPRNSYAAGRMANKPLNCTPRSLNDRGHAAVKRFAAYGFFTVTALKGRVSPANLKRASNFF